MIKEATVEEAIAAAAAAIDATASPFLRFEDVRLDADAGGDEAVFVTAVLRDHPQQKTYGSEELEPIDEAVWSTFRELGISRIPYVSFRQEHDAADADPGEEGVAP
jgi:hypothetical protein